VGAPGLLIAAVAWFVVKEFPRGVMRSEENQRFDIEQSFGEVVRYIIRKKTVRYHFLGFSFMAFTGYTILGFIGIVLTDIHGAGSLLPQYGCFTLDCLRNRQ
jgi:hypothetical protein